MKDTKLVLFILSKCTDLPGYSVEIFKWKVIYSQRVFMNTKSFFSNFLTC